MQYKKEEVKRAIMNSAEAEFFGKGFSGASIRKIVKNAGTTIGNFYNYFPNKETLFEELVKHDYDMFRGMIQNHGEIEKPDYLWDVSDIGIWRKNLAEFAEGLIPSLSDGFVLLMECSGGTKYESTRDEFITVSKEHFLEHARDMNLGNAYKETAEIIAEQLLNAIVMILKKYKDGNMRKKLITEYILFVFLGVMGILGE